MILRNHDFFYFSQFFFLNNKMLLFYYVIYLITFHANLGLKRKATIMRTSSLAFFSILVSSGSVAADEKKVADLAQKRFDAAEKVFKTALVEDKLPIIHFVSLRLLAVHKDWKPNSAIEAYQAHYHRMRKLDDK